MRGLAAGALVAAAAIVGLHASGQVLLKKTFIDTYRNLVTITTTFKVDEVHPQPNPIAADSDLHVAGRSQAIGLPMVMELTNGRLTAMADIEQSIHDVQGTGQAVQVTGVWRLWPEHKSADAMQQGQTVPVPANTNPKHVFEIHPITAFRGISTLATFAPVHDDQKPAAHYEATDAPTAFARYEKMTLKVDRTDPVFVSIDGPQTPYNYVEFILEVAGQPAVVQDGIFVLARVLDLNSQMLVADPKRMVLVKDSRPATLIGGAAAGKRFRVLGIPRINLERLMQKVKPNQSTPPVKGAYEMIIMAVIE